MKLTDTDAKGMNIFKSNRGAYISLPVEELEQAKEEIQKAIDHHKKGLPRFFVDKRKY